MNLWLRPPSNSVIQSSKSNQCARRDRFVAVLESSLLYITFTSRSGRSDFLIYCVRLPKSIAMRLMSSILRHGAYFIAELTSATRIACLLYDLH